MSMMEQDRLQAGATRSPACFLHIPKCAGTSVREALNKALPPGSLAPQGHVREGDPADYAHLPPELRSEFAVGLEEMRAIGRRYRAITGHFSLDMLLQVTDPASICTALREPRARVLSVYMWWRVPGAVHAWEADHPELHALRPLREFLSEPAVAYQIDNNLCRMLLGSDPRLPPQQFASKADLAAVAADAIERLESLGFVGAVELGDGMWQGISRVFGVTLHPTMARVTGEPGFTPRRLCSDDTLVDAETLDLIDQRAAGDTIVYEHVLARAGKDARERARIRRAALAAELVKLGDLVGYTTTREAERVAEAQREQLHDELQRARQELELTREWLTSVQASMSWRVTAPLRTAKRTLLTRHRGAVD